MRTDEGKGDEKELGKEMEVERSSCRKNGGR